MADGARVGVESGVGDITLATARDARSHTATPHLSPWADPPQPPARHQISPFISNSRVLSDARQAQQAPDWRLVSPPSRRGRVSRARSFVAVLLTGHDGACRTARRFYPTRPGRAPPHFRRRDHQPRQSNRRQWIRISRCMAADVAIIFRQRLGRRVVAALVDGLLAHLAALRLLLVRVGLAAVCGRGVARLPQVRLASLRGAVRGIRGRRPRRTGRPRRWSTPIPEPLRALRRSARRRLRWPLRRPMPTPVRRLG